MLDAPIEDLDVGSAAPVSAPSPATPTDFDLPPFPNDGGFVGLDGFSGVHTDDGFEHLETDLQDQFSTDIQFGNMHHDEPAHDFFDCSGDGSFARSPSSAFRDGGCGLQGSSSLASSSFTPLSDQPVVTASVHDAMFARGLLTNCDPTGIVLPWETGIFRELFSDIPMDVELVPKMPISDICDIALESQPQEIADSVANVALTTNANPIFSMTISCADDEHYEERRELMRDAAIGKLIIVLRHCLLASSTGRHIIDLGNAVDQDAGTYDIVSAVVGVRSPATLIKRANSLLSFLRWCAKTGSTVENPFVEPVAWAYFQHLRDTNAPATKAESIMSAFRFALHILGFETLTEVVNSRRLKGLAEIMMASKRLLKQALVLTVTQVLGLHSLLRNDGLHIMDRAIVAYVLVALYGRCRHSDLQLLHSLDCDFNHEGGFITLQTCHHKTGRMAALKTRLMPIVIPARGIDGSVWVQDALQVLFRAGVRLDTPIQGPLLRAPCGDYGAFMKRGLRSSEVSASLRRFLDLPDPVPGQVSEVVSSHSLKATTLAWCARYGLSPASRSMLGRHTSSLTETFAIYSRDLTCSPVAELQTVIDAIHDQRFMPDNPRSEFFRRTLLDTVDNENLPEVHGCDSDQVVKVESSDEETSEPVAEVENMTIAGGFEEPHVDVSDTSSTDPSSDSDEGLSSDDSDVVEPPPKVKRYRARVPADERWYVHSKSHLIHRFEATEQPTCSASFLVCGKRLTDAYTLCTEASAWNVLCKSCNRR